jgi:hypothetical protein
MGSLLINLMERRKKGEVSDRIVDSHFKELMADPAAAVETLYGQMGRPFLGEHADKIRAYIANKPKGKFGRHKYSPEAWGFEPEEIRAQTRAYTDHYGVTLEG